MKNKIRNWIDKHPLIEFTITVAFYVVGVVCLIESVIYDKWLTVLALLVLLGIYGTIDYKHWMKNRRK